MRDREALAMYAQEARAEQRPAYLLTWNPGKWPWPTLRREIARLRKQGFLAETWGCGVNRSIEPGSRLYLMRLGESPKGIIGSGWASSRPYEALHWDEAKARRGDLAMHIDLRVDHLAEQPILPLELLTVSLPPFRWTPQSSGVRVPPRVAGPLAVLWAQVTASLARV